MKKKLPIFITPEGRAKYMAAYEAMFSLMIASKGTVFEETFIHLMEMVTQYCLPAMMFPTVYTEEELKQIEMPALLLKGKADAPVWLDIRNDRVKIRNCKIPSCGICRGHCGAVVKMKMQ